MAVVTCVAMNSSGLTNHVDSPRRYLKYLACLLVAIAGVHNDYLTLFSSPAAVGLDGYYYVLQVDGLTKGELFFSTHTPLVLYYLTSLRLLIGDSVTAIKMGTIILELALWIGVGCLLIQCMKSWSLGIIGASYAALAGLHYFMIGEFVSNLGGLSFIVAGLFCLQRARQRTSKWLWLISLLFFALAIASHRSSGFILIAMGLASCWIFAIRQAASVRKGWVLLALCIGFLAVYFSPYLTLMQPFVQLPDRMTQELSMRPRWPVTPYTIFDVLSVLWAAPLILAITIKQSWGQVARGGHLFLPGLALLSVILNLNIFVKPDLIAFGVIGRFQTLMYLQVALLVPYAIWLLGKMNRKWMAYAFAFSIPLLILGTRTDLPPGLRPEYLRDREELIKALSTSIPQVSRDSVIVAPHGDEFVIMSRTGISSRNARPLNAKSEIYWLLQRVPSSLVSPSITPLTLHAGSRSVLIKDDELWQLWEEMSPANKQRILLSNLPLKRYVMKS